MSLKLHRGALVAVVAAFVLGAGAGSVVVPVMAERPAASDATPDPAPPPARATALVRGGYEAEVVRILDGDTFEARVRIWPGLDMTTKVRLRGIDAPEMRARCSEERVKAEAAREALRAILAEGDVVIARVGLDKYGGRVDADAATRRTPDVSAAMLAKGLARPYGGGRRESWCAGL